MRPDSEADLAKLVAGLTRPVRIVGGGTRGMAGSEAALSTAGLRGISLYEPGALTLVAQAGTPVTEIEAALAAEGQRLAFEPMDHRALLARDGTPTIGGVVAANISGPRRIQAGACRDFCLGVRFVDGRGDIICNGGRVMKNVTGYDLVKLMAGSWGTLGVLTEVALKVLPTPETQATVEIAVEDAGQAVAALSNGLGSPFEVTGAAYDPTQGRAFLRIEGFEASVSYRARQLEARMARFGDVAITSDCGTLWRDIRDMRKWAGLPGDVWRVSARPGDAVDLVARGGAGNVFLDWGGGLIWMLLPEGTDLRARLGRYDGHATLVRASSATFARLDWFQPQPAPLAAISQGLRQQFDPEGRFNPGVMD